MHTATILSSSARSPVRHPIGNCDVLLRGPERFGELRVGEPFFDIEVEACSLSLLGRHRSASVEGAASAGFATGE